MSTLPLVLALTLLGAEPQKPFKIQVVDEQTGRGVPLVELRTVNDVVYVTDSAGVVAFDEPGILGKEVYFGIDSHGYEYQKDGFGFRGARVQTEPGGSKVLKIRRLNVAERLYRVTGGGIYRDSLLVGDTPPISQPLLNGEVFGSDSVVTAAYRGKLFWFWGDTVRPLYPLGLYDVPGATSKLPADGLDPSKGIDLTYFTRADGFVRPMCKMPGEGPTWIQGLTVVPDASGRERMFAKYMKIKNLLTVYERGIAEYDDPQEQFVHRVTFPEDAGMQPGGHPFRHKPDGQEYVYFADPYPLTRVKATAESFLDLAQYETFTYFPAGAPQSKDPERGSEGKLVLAWKANARPLDAKLEQTLLKENRLKPDERYFAMADARTGKAIQVHGGSVNWNEYRKKFVMIFVEFYGTSVLGEVWYSEADAPTGPWTKAVKIATHTKYDFYNPKHHPQFDQEEGRVIYFEGTYTNTFSGNPHRTPRYNYNQLTYRLDLSDPRLHGK